MSADATATHIPPTSHLKSSYLASPRSMNNLVMPTPMAAHKKCPKKTLRGWDKGDSTALYSRIADAPYHYFLLVSFHVE